MKKKFGFECWNCPKIYFLTLEITDQQEIILSCPYCNAEAVVNLAPFYNKTRTVLRGGESNLDDIDAPDIFLTKRHD